MYIPNRTSIIPLAPIGSLGTDIGGWTSLPFPLAFVAELCIELKWESGPCPFRRGGSGSLVVGSVIENGCLALEYWWVTKKGCASQNVSLGSSVVTSGSNR